MHDTPGKDNNLPCCLDADKHGKFVTDQQKFCSLLGIHCNPSNHQLVAHGQNRVAVRPTWLLQLPWRELELAAEAHAVGWQLCEPGERALLPAQGCACHLHCLWTRSQFCCGLLMHWSGMGPDNCAAALSSYQTGAKVKQRLLPIVYDLNAR